MFAQCDFLLVQAIGQIFLHIIIITIINLALEIELMVSWSIYIIS